MGWWRRSPVQPRIIIRQHRAPFRYTDPQGYPVPPGAWLVYVDGSYRGIAADWQAAMQMACFALSEQHWKHRHAWQAQHESHFGWKDAS